VLRVRVQVSLVSPVPARSLVVLVKGRRGAKAYPCALSLLTPKSKEKPGATEVLVVRGKVWVVHVEVEVVEDPN
jgi:hypothetical protein